MLEKLQAIEREAFASLNYAQNVEELEQIRVKYLGKKGEITAVLREMGSLPPEQRPVVGQHANQLRERIEQKLKEAKEQLMLKEQSAKLLQETIDVTLPGKRIIRGKKHPLTLVVDDVKRIFISMGFDVEEGPEIESDYYNFEALNFPPNHPARDMQDSFYVKPDGLLRTHTSPVQARTLQKRLPELPVRIIVPGRVYRKDDIDATHSAMFTQIEGLVVDKGISFGDFKGTLAYFVQRMFGRERKVRFRPSFFPFTEPSAEVDVSCIICGGEGCRLCSGSGWLEIMGAGMVHPRVLEMAGYDPEEVTGFAFGMGVERIAMLKYRIDDIRLFYENDIRFLEQF